MHRADPPHTTSPATPQSWFARYRAWEQRLFARKISDPQDLAGIKAYSDYFYSWRGWWIHAVELLLTVGLALWLRSWLGLSLWFGVPAGYAMVSLLAAYIILAWFTPRFYVKKYKFSVTKITLFMLGGVVAGVISGALVKSLRTEERIPTMGEFADVFVRAAQHPLVWLTLGALLLWFALLAGLAHGRKHQLTQENALLAAASERDQAARVAAEAQLKVLQVQIKPHFLFNTLAAMQHWVDSKDERAGPLLRNLTQFLRQSVTALDKPFVTLAEELALVQPYLAIMAARMGDRFSYAVDAAAHASAQHIPPGVVLTLAENALEHGITPALRGGHVQVRVGRSATGQGAARVWVEVIDNGVGFSGSPQLGVGLRNTQDRLRALYGAAAGLTLARDDARGHTIARIELGESTQ